MTILSRPVATSTPSAAWEVIAGGTNRFMVQQQLSGTAKEQQQQHALTPGDVALCRILYSTSDVDFDAVPMVRESSPTPVSASNRNSTSRESITSTRSFSRDVRLVVALADSQDEILRDWDEVKECWRRGGGLFDIDEWENFYQGIIRIREEEEREAADGANHSVSRLLGASPQQLPCDENSSAAGPQSGSFSDHSFTSAAQSNAPSAGSLVTDASAVVKGTRKEDVSAAADHHSGCSAEEVWVARLVGAWLWTDAYQSTLLVALFAHGYFAHWMSWWAAWVILYLAGMTFPRYRRHVPSPSTTTAAGTVSSEESRDAEDALGMTGAEIRSLVAAVQRWQQVLQLDTPKAVQSTLASMALLNYAMSVFLPPQLTLGSLFEAVVCPLIAVSLLCSLVYVKLWRRRPASLASPLAADRTVTSLAEGRPSATSTRELSPEPLRPAASSGAVAAATSPPQAPPVLSVHSTDVIPDTILKGLELYGSSEWKHKVTKYDVVFEEMQSPYCDKKACRFTCRVPNTTAYAAELMLCDDPLGTNAKSYAYRFDTLLTEKRFVKTIDAFSSVYHTIYKSPVFGVSGRDMVACLTPKFYINDLEMQKKLGLLPRDDKRTSAKAIFFQAGTDLGKHHPQEAKYVRGAIHRYLLMGREEEDASLTLCMTMNVDPQGIIPARVVELTNAEQCKKLSIMRDILKEIGAVQPPGGRHSPCYSAGQQQQDKDASGQITLTSNPPPPPQAEEPSSPSLPSAVSGIIVDDIDDNVDRAVSLLLKETWTQVQAKDGVVYYTATTSWCDKKAVRVEMFVPNVKAHALDRVINNPASAKAYDRLLAEKKVIKDVTDRIQLVHSMYKSPVMGVAARDFVTRVTPKTYLGTEQLETLHLSKFPLLGQQKYGRRGIAFVYCGTDAQAELGPVPKFTRGVVHCFGLFALEEVSPDGEVLGVTLVQVSSMDPCGKIPRSLVDATNVEQMEKLKIIAKLMTSV